MESGPDKIPMSQRWEEAERKARRRDDDADEMERFVNDAFRHSTKTKGESPETSLRESNQAELDRLNKELEIVKAVMEDWKITTIGEYGKAVDLLVDHYNLNPEDAIKLVNKKSTLDRWDTPQAIAESLRAHGLDRGGMSR